MLPPENWFKWEWWNKIALIYEDKEKGCRYNNKYNVSTKFLEVRKWMGNGDWFRKLGKNKTEVYEKKPISKVLLPRNPLRFRAQRHQEPLEKGVLASLEVYKRYWDPLKFPLFEEIGKSPD